MRMTARKLSLFHVSILTRVPLTPAPLSIPAAELKFCSVSAARSVNAIDVLADPLLDGDKEEPVDDPKELEDVEELGELDDFAVLDDGLVGWKAELPLPKPMALASVPLPTSAIESFWFLLLTTSLPLLLSEAVTCALVGRSRLIASIRSPTVSVPVDVYVVAFKPALIVIVPPGRIPKLDSGVPVVSTAEPMPVAGPPDVLVVRDVPGDPEFEENDAAVALDDDEPEWPCNRLWTPATSWELTRCKA